MTRYKFNKAPKGANYGINLKKEGNVKNQRNISPFRRFGKHEIKMLVELIEFSMKRMRLFEIPMNVCYLHSLLPKVSSFKNVKIED